MKAFRIGPVLVQPIASPTGVVWAVSRDTWLQVASSEGAAEALARRMATDLGAPLDASPRVALPVG